MCVCVCVCECVCTTILLHVNILHTTPSMSNSSPGEHSRKKSGTMRRIALSLASNIIESGESTRKLLVSKIKTERPGFKLKRTRSGGALTTEPEMLPAMQAMWQDKPIIEMPVAKDLPRLIRRVVLLGDSEQILHDCPPAAEDDDTSDARALQLSAQFILALCRNLESETKAKEIESDVLAAVDTPGEPQDAVKAMLAVLGEEAESSTLRALKTIHQDIVGHCTFELKQHITSRFMTKDVRTPEGWRITLRLAPDQVQVSHTRREQSIDPGGDKTNHWEFEWELRLLFDHQVTEMRVAQLRVTDLFLSQTIDPQLEEEIKHDLLGGEIL